MDNVNIIKYYLGDDEDSYKYSGTFNLFVNTESAVVKELSSIFGVHNATASNKGLMSLNDKSKLYDLPTNDELTNKLNDKASTAVVTTTDNGLMSANDKIFLDAVSNNITISDNSFKLEHDGEGITISEYTGDITLDAYSDANIVAYYIGTISLHSDGNIKLIAGDVSTISLNIDSTVLTLVDAKMLKLITLLNDN